MKEKPNFNNLIRGDEILQVIKEKEYWQMKEQIKAFKEKEEQMKE